MTDTIPQTAAEARANYEKIADALLGQCDERPEHPSVDITPEMIAAGLVALHESGWLEHNSPSDAALVEDILSAAMACGSRSANGD